MKKTMGRKFIFYFILNSLVVIPLIVKAQEMLCPLHRNILLSGNFGELRATHFHSGIDIRTGGVEGLPVICVKDGQLVRVSVSPVGYGNALYIEHPDGTTTVYGHLQRFVPQLAEIVRELQYEKESFQLDQDFRAYQLSFHQGDTIAYSGNTGSSGGPHLHFEVRNTQTEHILNPLRFYSIRDTRDPVVRKLYFYSVDENDCEQQVGQYALNPAADGRYRLGRITLPAGRIGVGVYVTDYMNDSWNKLGVYRMTLIAGRDTLFALSMDSCAFDRNCFINAIKDFDHYKVKETVYRCFGNRQDDFPGLRSRNKGYLNIQRDSILQVELCLFDINRNESRVSFTLKGGREQAINEKEGILRYDQAHILELPDCHVKLPVGALQASVRKYLKIDRDTLTGQNIFILAEKVIPLFKKAHLVLTGNFSPQALICELDEKGQKFPVETFWAFGVLEANIGYLGRFTILEDLRAPEISYLGSFSDRTLRFKVKDNLSGLAKWRGEVNGKWCLFSYDPRIDLLQCSLTEPVFRQGQVNEVKINVEDKVGNKRELVVKVRN